MVYLKFACTWPGSSTTISVVYKWKSKMNIKIYVQVYYSLQQCYKQQKTGSNPNSENRCIFKL